MELLNLSGQLMTRLRLGLTRRQALTVLISGIGTANAQTPTYPAAKAVKIIVPFAAGAGTDAMGRLMAQKRQVSVGHAD